MRRLLALFLLVAVAGALLTAAGYWLLANPPAPLARPRILTLTLDGPIAEHDVSANLPFLPASERLTLATLHRALAAARGDASVLGLAVVIQDPDLGLAKAQEVRRLLGTFAAAGKRLECYLDTAGEGSNGTLEYYLATACDAIVLAPPGEINLLGLYLDSPFLRGGLDKLRIEPSFLTAGTYKSAAEGFTGTAHSPAAREALDAVLDGFYGRILEDIATRRGVDVPTVRGWVDGAPHGAEEALSLGLVDRLGYPDEFRAALDGWAEKPPRQIDLLDYSRSAARPASGPEIAVLYAQGTIYRGSGGVDAWSGEPVIGSETLVAELDRLAEDDGVAAVVLRVDSPGGSALASDLILRAAERLRDKKPLVASFSDVAASGGYYIAARATKIVAEATSLTGSIGVVSGKLATGRFQSELLGVTHDPLARGANADLYSSLEPFAGEQLAQMRRRIDAVYARFVGHVAAGRGLEPAAVEAVAGGRVWTGADALARGLVDELGGLDRAIELAAEAAGLSPDAAHPLLLLPRRHGFWEWLRGLQPERLDAARLAARLLSGALREPFELELPAAWRELARPF